MKKVNLHSIIWREGKHYVAQCLNVDVSSFGQSRRTALANLAEALELYFADNNKPTVTRIDRPMFVRTALHYA